MLRKNETDEGVKLLTRLEKRFDSGFQVRDLRRSWLSIRAILSFDVSGDAPAKY